MGGNMNRVGRPGKGLKEPGMILCSGQTLEGPASVVGGRQDTRKRKEALKKNRTERENK